MFWRRRAVKKAAKYWYARAFEAALSVQFMFIHWDCAATKRLSHWWSSQLLSINTQTTVTSMSARQLWRRKIGNANGGGDNGTSRCWLRDVQTIFNHCWFEVVTSRNLSMWIDLSFEFKLEPFRFFIDKIFVFYRIQNSNGYGHNSV